MIGDDELNFKVNQFRYNMLSSCIKKVIFLRTDSLLLPVCLLVYCIISCMLHTIFCFALPLLQHIQYTKYYCK